LTPFAWLPLAFEEVAEVEAEVVAEVVAEVEAEVEDAPPELRVGVATDAATLPA
jgi:actin-like ATPase involved in cell morphogenesis